MPKRSNTGSSTSRTASPSPTDSSKAASCMATASSATSLSLASIHTRSSGTSPSAKRLCANGTSANGRNAPPPPRANSSAVMHEQSERKSSTCTGPSSRSTPTITSLETRCPHDTAPKSSASTATGLLPQAPKAKAIAKPKARQDQSGQRRCIESTPLHRHLRTAHSRQPCPIHPTVKCSRPAAHRCAAGLLIAPTGSELQRDARKTIEAVPPSTDSAMTVVSRPVGTFCGCRTDTGRR